MFLGTLSPISNRTMWSENYELTDADDGDLIDLSAVDEITLHVRDPQTQAKVLSGTLTGGEVIIVDTGVFQWSFTADQVRGLCPKTYEVGCIIEQDGQSVQLLIGTLAVLDGIVT